MRKGVIRTGKSVFFITLCHVPTPTGDAYARSHPAAVRQRHWRGGACCRAFGPGEADAPPCDADCVNAVRLLWAANDTEALVEFWQARSHLGTPPSTAPLLQAIAMSTRTAELCRLTLFRDILSGPTTVLTAPGDYDLSDAPSQLGDVNDDDVTSLRLGGRDALSSCTRTTITLGGKLLLTQGEHDLEALVHAGGANDEASSVRLKYDPSRRIAPGECRLVLFRDDKQEGPTTVLSKPGKYIMFSQDLDGDVKDDDVTSLRLDGGPGCVASLHENGDFSGWKADFGPGVFDLSDLARRGGINDQTSAVRLQFPSPQ